MHTTTITGVGTAWFAHGNSTPRDATETAIAAATAELDAAVDAATRSGDTTGTVTHSVAARSATRHTMTSAGANNQNIIVIAACDITLEQVHIDGHER